MCNEFDPSRKLDRESLPGINSDIMTTTNYKLRFEFWHASRKTD